MKWEIAAGLLVIFTTGVLSGTELNLCSDYTQLDTLTVPCVWSNAIPQQSCVGMVASVHIVFWMPAEIRQRISERNVSAVNLDKTIIWGTEVQNGFYNGEEDRARWNINITFIGRNLLEYKVMNDDLRTKDEFDAHFAVDINGTTYKANHSTWFKVNETCPSITPSPHSTSPVANPTRTSSNPTSSSPSQETTTASAIKYPNDLQSEIVHNLTQVLALQQKDPGNTWLDIFSFLFVTLLTVMQLFFNFDTLKKILKKVRAYFRCGKSNSDPSTPPLSDRPLQSPEVHVQMPSEPSATTDAASRQPLGLEGPDLGERSEEDDDGDPRSGGDPSSSRDGENSLADTPPSTSPSPGTTSVPPEHIQMRSMEVHTVEVHTVEEEHHEQATGCTRQPNAEGTTGRSSNTGSEENENDPLLKSENALTWRHKSL